MDQISRKYLKLFRSLYHIDIPEFIHNHRQLFAEAKLTGDHAQVTKAYYAVMSSLIEASYGTSMHFCPPEHHGQDRMMATRRMHERVTQLLQHAPGKRALDIGCGVGSMLRDVARFSGGQVIGMTLGDNEVRESNHLTRRAGLEKICDTVQGDCHAMPFADGSFDAAYAVYSLKYFTRLQPIFAQVERVLRPGGTFLIYDIVKTPMFDPHNAEHTRLVNFFEFACGMPALHTNHEMRVEAERAGLEWVSELDLANGDDNLSWHYYFSQSATLMWLMRSPWVARMIRALEWSRILPKGFAEFNEIFLAGTVRALVDAGQKGLISGSNIVLFRKPAAARLLTSAA